MPTDLFTVSYIYSLNFFFFLGGVIEKSYDGSCVIAFLATNGFINIQICVSAYHRLFNQNK